MKNYKLLIYCAITVPYVANVEAEDLGKPNILVILADDLGTNELSCYGGQNIKTPNIDKIAKEGVLFNNNFASSTMSVPIRASLYTGLFPVKHGSYQNHKKSNSNIKSITSYLPELGYRVGRAGKQHTTPRSVYDFEEVPGFEENCVSPTAYYSVDGIKEFISRSNEPFCLFVCSTHPHVPWTWGDQDAIDENGIVLPPNCVDNAETRKLYKNYLAEILALDEEVGAVLAVLEHEEKVNNTLVVFLGEQGPQFPFGKWTCYNYGQHSALLARLPGKIKENSTNNALVQYEDVLPTIIDLAGGNEVAELDGKSFLETLFGRSKGRRKWIYGIHNNIPEGTAYPIRSIQDGRFKLIINLLHEKAYFEKHLMNVNNKRSVWKSWIESTEYDENAQKLVSKYTYRPSIEFYDLKKDPWEMNNIAHLNKYDKRIKKMKKELYKWMNEQKDMGAEMDVRKSQ